VRKGKTWIVVYRVMGLRTADETGEEGLIAQIGVVLLEVLLGGGDELDGGELEAALLEAADDVAA
jgi:hypothetical protein